MIDEFSRTVNTFLSCVSSDPSFKKQTKREIEEHHWRSINVQNANGSQSRKCR